MSADYGSNSESTLSGRENIVTTNYTTPAESHPGPPPKRAAGWFLAAGTFIAGLLIGAVAVGLFSEGSPVPQATAAGGQTSTSASASRGTTEGTGASGATAQVTVNDACLQALTAAQEAATNINAIADAAKNFDARRLDEIVRGLQPLEQRLNDDIAACNVTSELPNGVIVSGATTPTPAQSSSSSAAPATPTS